MVLRGGLGSGYEPRKPKGGRLGKRVSRLPQEDRIETKFKAAARRQPGSGNQLHRPGDFEGVEPESVVLDGKTTTKNRSIVITMAQLRKVDREARGLRKTGGLIVGFETMSPPVEQDWALIPLGLLIKLMQQADWDLEMRDGG